MSQNKLARKLGITSGFMSQALTGKRGVGPETRQKLMAALPTLDFDDLFEIVPVGDLQRLVEV
jgi:transcriptional regulator with XRE-family HTH domain